MIKEKNNVKIRNKDDNQLFLDCGEKAKEFLKKIDDLGEGYVFIPSSVVRDIKDDFEQYYNFLKDKNINSLDLPKQLKLNIENFLRAYPETEKIIEEINEEIGDNNQRILDAVKKADDFAQKIDDFKKSTEYIPSSVVGDIKEYFEEYYDILVDEDIESLDLSEHSKSNIVSFLRNYPEIKKIIDEINEKLHIEILQKEIDDNVEIPNRFNRDLNYLLDSDFPIEYKQKKELTDSYVDFFNLVKEANGKMELSNPFKKFLNDYKRVDALVEKHNEEIKIRKHKQFVLAIVRKINDFNQRISDFKDNLEFIPSTVTDELKADFKECFDILMEEDIESLNLPDQSKSNITSFLKDYPKTKEIIDEINEELRIEILQKELDDSIETLNQFNKDLNYLLDSDFYITFKQKDELIKTYIDLFNLVKEANNHEKINLPNRFKEFLKRYSKIEISIKSKNEDYVQSELKKHKEFFDDIDGKSLDLNQRLAVVKDELNTQIIAGAGCGKTLTLNAKARYLIEKKGVNPTDILCLSFSKSSVDDLEKSLPEGIEIATFHSLGGKILSYNNQVSSVADKALDKFIEFYFLEHIINNKELSKDFFEFYSFYIYENIEEEDVDSIGEVYDIEEARDFTTLRELYGGENEKVTFKNEVVKSFEELIIANYLFAHQIDYVYEKVYDYKNKNFLKQKKFIFDLVFSEVFETMPSLKIINLLVNDLCPVFEVKERLHLKNNCDGNTKKNKKNYTPDFYLVDEDIYLEHFGVNRNGQARWLNKEKSDEYVEGIKWKRNIHRDYGTKLIETYSYYMSEDRLLSRLEEKLRNEGVEIKEIDYEYVISKIAERKDVKKFINVIKLIKSFINLFKGNDYSVEKFNEFREINMHNPRIFDRKRTELFLNVVEDIYISYQECLTKNYKIDFNDMINNATREVKKGHLKDKYKYIFVDEYQDTSHTRYNFIKSIQDKTRAKVCVVGDDWQSIFRFTGCDISLFTNFENYFENPEKLRIETTYRNSQELIDISGNFIRKNKNQLNKQLKSKRESIEKPVKIMYYVDRNKEDRIKAMIGLVEEISKNSNEILILGRNKSDINVFIDNSEDDDSRIKPFWEVKNENSKDEDSNHRTLIYKKNKDLKIEFMTIHKSKGLERDNVILINLRNSKAGFPNQIEDDPVLDFVISDSDKYEFGEERRLFYVALTRTKNNVYLLAPDTNKSSFLMELEENGDDLEILKNDYSLFENLDDFEEFMDDKKSYSIVTSLKCPVCGTGDVKLILSKNEDTNEVDKFFRCSHNNKCGWNGGFYDSYLELLDEIEICPKCGGVMYVINGTQGPFYFCSNNCKTPKIDDEKLKRVNEIIQLTESNINFETHKTHLNCPKCGDGNIILKINPRTINNDFECSNESCNWHGGRTRVSIDDLDKIIICPKCNGILTLKNGQNGKFYGCSNYPACKFTIDKNGDMSKWEKFDTKLTCPSCNDGDVILLRNKETKKGFFKCTNNHCMWYGGSFNKSLNFLDTLDYCPEDDCKGLTYEVDGYYGPFKVCTFFSENGCQAGKRRR